MAGAEASTGCIGAGSGCSFPWCAAVKLALRCRISLEMAWVGHGEREQGQSLGALGTKVQNKQSERMEKCEKQEEDEEKDAEDGAGEMSLVIWKSWIGTKPWWGGHGHTACYFSSLCWLKVSKANPWRIPCTLCEGHR